MSTPAVPRDQAASEALPRARADLHIALSVHRDGLSHDLPGILDHILELLEEADAAETARNRAMDRCQP